MKKINKKFGQSIRIEWIDAISYSSWKSIKEASADDNDTRCVTKGVFVSEDKIFVTICHTLAKYNPAEGDIGGVFKIPKKMITKVT